jgi:hypothetical protein
MHMSISAGAGLLLSIVLTANASAISSDEIYGQVAKHFSVADGYRVDEWTGGGNDQ